MWIKYQVRASSKMQPQTKEIHLYQRIIIQYCSLGSWHQPCQTSATGRWSTLAASSSNFRANQVFFLAKVREDEKLQKNVQTWFRLSRQSAATQRVWKGTKVRKKLHQIRFHLRTSKKQLKINDRCGLPLNYLSAEKNQRQIAQNVSAWFEN